jgi:serine/threonine-protein kinase
MEMDARPLFVCGEYEFITWIGGGGQSNVYRVRSRKYNCIFAGKIIDSGGPESVEELAEFEAMRTLYHPNIVNCYDAFRDDRGLILIFEFSQGGTLQDEIRSTGGLPIEQVKSVGRQLISALSCIHERGLAHRDVKPSNVLLDGRRQTAKLADFGLAVRSEGKHKRAGTPLFMSREAWLGYEHDLQLGDVWQLGVTLATALRGDLPWGAESRQGVVRRIIECDAEFPCADAALLAAIGGMICPEAERMRIAELRELPVFGAAGESSALPRIEGGGVRRSGSDGLVRARRRVPRLQVADMAPRRASWPSGLAQPQGADDE